MALRMSHIPAVDQHPRVSLHYLYHHVFAV